MLLCMTSTVVRAIHEARKIAEDELRELCMPGEPSLEKAEVGNPISHGQLIALSKLLRNHANQLLERDVDGELEVYTLDELLKGSKFYIPPPPPKKEPTPEYKALMESLRREEEARQYQRMLNPRPSTEFAVPSLAHHDPREAAFEQDEVTYQDVHRQMILIINVLVSIIACSVFIWIAARHWSAPKRLGLSMSGSGLIGIAEVVIYNGYVRRVKEAKLKEKKKPEIKQIIQSWVIDGASEKNESSLSTSKEQMEKGVRYRKGKHR